MAELTYTKCGDYYIPNIKIREQKTISKYGRMHREYLRNSHPLIFTDLVLHEKLYDVCAEIDEAAESRRAVIIPRLCEIYGVTEQLKAEDPMEWTRQMNMIEHDVEENILTELVYA